MEPLLSPETFAERAAEELIEAIVDGTLGFDRQQFALVIKSGTGKALKTIYLHRYYQSYKNAPANLTTILTDVARFFRRQDDFCDYGLVAPHLMPVMRDYAENYLDWCHLKREYGDAVGNYQALLWCEHLVIFPVIDTGESQVRVTSRMLEDWSQDFDTVIEQAANNLIAKTEHFDFASIYDNETGTDCCHESTWNDHYDAMRLCYFSFPDLSVSGKRLYLLVNPSKLFIWGAGDVLGTACALQKLDEMSGANSVVRKLPPYVLCDAPGGGFEIYKPDPKREEALCAALSRHQLQYQFESYARQLEFLSSDADVLQNDLFVSKFVALQAKDGSLRSTCTWTQTVECLLPKTDSIGFSVVNEEKTKATFLGEVQWKDAVKILGDQMIPEPGMYPPRFRTVGFPSKEQLQRLGIRV